MTTRPRPNTESPRRRRNADEERPRRSITTCFGRAAGRVRRHRLPRAVAAQIGSRLFRPFSAGVPFVRAHRLTSQMFAADIDNLSYCAASGEWEEEVCT